MTNTTPASAAGVHDTPVVRKPSTLPRLMPAARPAAAPVEPIPTVAPRVEAPSAEPPATPPPAAPAPLACPKCSTPLVDPTGLGWCQRCGYCRALGGEVASKEAKANAPGSKSLRAWSQVIADVPRWMWVMLSGMFAICVYSYCVGLMLRGETWTGIYWSLCQVLVGLLMAVVGQIWALVLLGYKDDKVGIKDLFFVSNLWKLILGKLPRTCKQVWLCVWGSTTIFACLFFILDWPAVITMKIATPPGASAPARQP